MKSFNFSSRRHIHMQCNHKQSASNLEAKFGVEEALVRAVVHLPGNGYKVLSQECAQQRFVKFFIAFLRDMPRSCVVIGI